MAQKHVVAALALIALSTGLAAGQEITAKSGTGKLLNIYKRHARTRATTSSD